MDRVDLILDHHSYSETIYGYGSWSDMNLNGKTVVERSEITLKKEVIEQGLRSVFLFVLRRITLN